MWDLSAARRLVAGQASEYGLPPLRVADVALVADELLANSIEHGAGTATLRMWSTDTALVCQVEGTTRLTNPLAGRIPAPPWQLCGRGLLIVNHLADLVRTHSSTTGTTIRAYFTPHQRPRPRHLIQLLALVSAPTATSPIVSSPAWCGRCRRQHS